ncbi:helix-turn-helix domain-containing protein [Streptomyces sp. NPDC102364]|uniref:helix-turn-helix domain-containing protein n=1 Tax=Streptomyces sp. NPDC102364 TaxID=3366161 RepID=UPI003827537C
MTTEDHVPSRACYQRGCRDAGCELANYRYMSRLRLERARGKRRTVDAAQTIAHTERLLARGWSHRQIANAANIGDRTVGEMLAHRERVLATTARAILAIEISDPPQAPRYVPILGSQRRLQALVAFGWPFADIARHIGFDALSIARIAQGANPNVLHTTAMTINRTYRHLSCTPGPSVRARNYAKKHGWHGPLAWDDIDDPKANPEVELRGEKRGRPAQVDELRIARLVREGLTNGQIAQLVGCHVRTVTRARGRITPETLKEAA